MVIHKLRTPNSLRDFNLFLLFYFLFIFNTGICYLSFLLLSNVLTLLAPSCCSKSEYIRCLHFTCEDSLYVATNQGYLYHAKLSKTRDVKWTELVQVSNEVPIVCMDVLSLKSSELSGGVEDWLAVGDGKGYMTIVKVLTDVSAPKVSLTFSWQAGMQRQLLGTYWCKSLGYR